MDFMKVFDQTVREIKREVNLKVLKVPEIEQKVLDATDDEPWGPHGTVMAEIAKATKKYSECQLVMDVLWTRLSETGKNWRLVYKALSVIEYLVAHGSERAVDEIVEHTFQISSLASFEYVEPSGKDLGINVRKKAETIVKLLNDKDKIQEIRDKAAANSEKYFGLSSSGITYKSGSSSFSSSNFRNNDRVGGYGYSGNSEAFKDNYEGKGYGKDKYDKATKQKKNPSRYGRKEQDSPASSASKSSTRISKADQHPSVSSQNAESDKYEDFDDFDPRGTSTSKPSAGSNQVDLFGQNFVDLLGEPVSLPTDKPTSLDNDPSEVDLFADADFVSAPATQETKNHVPQTNVDLFASQPSPAVSATVDFFGAPEPVSQLDNEATKSTTTSNIVDPFATVPMNGFEESDSFGEFTSHADDSQTSPSDGRHGNMNRSSIGAKPTPPKKESFQVKSGVWADSLSRGLIDLNITGPKKVDLSDVGIVGGLNYGSEEKDKGSLPSFYTGTGMSTGTVTGIGTGTGMSMGYGATRIGSGAGKPGFTSSSTSTSTPNDDFFSSLSSQQYQFGGFRK